MATSKRIVLVDPLGDILFSGESMMSVPPAEELETIEPCPETKRSAESGVYRAVDPNEQTVPADSESSDAEIRTPKRGPRAA